MPKKPAKVAQTNGVALTTGALWDAHLMIGDLAEAVYTQRARISPKASYGLSRNRRLLKSMAESLIEARKELLRACDALNEQGEPKTKNEGRDFDIAPEHLQQFKDGWKELRDVEAGDFAAYVIPFEYFEDAVGVAPPHFDAMLAIGMLAEPKEPT